MNNTAKLLSLAAPLALLSVASLTAQTTWTGAVDNNWNNASNWTSGTPDTNTNTVRAIVALDGANLTMSTNGSGRLVQISGNGAVGPTLNMTEDFVTTFSSFSVGSVDETGAAAAGYNGTVNHTSGAFSISGSAGTRRLSIAGAGGAATGTGTYNFGGLAAASSPSLTLSGGTDVDIILGSSSGETGNFNLSGFGTVNVSGTLRAAQFNGDANINIVGGNLDINVNAFEMSQFAAGDTNLNVTMDSTGFSTINVAGATSFGEGDAFFNLSLGSGFSASLGETFTIVSSDSFGLLQGQTVAEFTNVADGDTVTVDGYSFLAGYDAGDFTLQTTVIPEPGTYALLAGMGALCSIMLRRRRA